MTITIKLKTDNEAFADDKDAEVRRILHEWARRSFLPGGLRDSNGNTVGSVTVTGK